MLGEETTQESVNEDDAKYQQVGSEQKCSFEMKSRSLTQRHLSLNLKDRTGSLTWLTLK